MNYYTDTVTLGSTGPVSLSIGFRPIGARFRVCSSYSTPGTYARLSLGNTDGTRQFCTSILQGTTAGTSRNSATKVVSHFSGTSITEILAAEFIQFTSNGMDLNVLIANTDYQVILECWA